MSKKRRKMADKSAELNAEVVSWEVPEYEKSGHDRRWYIFAVIIGILLIAYAIWTKNYLFVFIIVLSAFIIFLYETNQAMMIIVEVNKKGISVGRKFYEYARLKHFAIVYKPELEIKNLYLEFRDTARPRMTIHLKDVNPIALRNLLSKYLQEDLDRTDIPLSEGLSRLLKL
jgi:hypothetical protein